ncbi:pyridoxal phosphate-dependent aminotransferase [Maricaulis parjimensis]|uniref:pyridoxal phosphate-dependent aminotransferase n=1 Tax=Maricaulis parjimensis TaxID=144023 RepID=UPI00193A9E3B|nr:pyridoxal phosphate-dependent aminotransferase [Maricaulis parjimensis]
MSYAHWIRQIIGRLRDEPREAWSLFDSSVPEPEALLRELIADAFAEPVTSRYTSAFVSGNPYTVSALARRYGMPRAAFICTTGATEGLHTIYRALLEPGDHILIETPNFELFDSLARSHRCEIGHVARRAPRFELDMDALKAALRPTTRMVVVSNLHNPSSEPLPREQLDELVALAETHDFWLVVDEVYSDYVPEAQRAPVAAALSDKAITVSSLTKIYGLSTVRCGWIIASGDTLETLRDFNDRHAFGVSKLGHAVAALVLENPAPFDAYVTNLVSVSRPVFARFHKTWEEEGLIEGHVPDHGCIAFPRLVGIADTRAFSDWLMTHYGVIVAPGELFSLPGHVRIGYALPADQLEQGLSLFTEGLRAYHGEQARKVIGAG